MRLVLPILLASSAPGAAISLSRRPQQPSAPKKKARKSFPAASRAERCAAWLARVPAWKVQRVLYGLTSVNTAFAVYTNDHRNVPWPMRKATEVTSFYTRLFFFAKLRPRVLFVIGAVMRALQLTTALQHVFDPKAGCGTGLNLLALFAGSRWPAPIVLGWATTRLFWKALGAEQPAPVRVPIVVNIADYQ
mmetsp:Transcript_5805/g.17506  ORF Transcript_5805/g.17506 Transcript_5805/m.17506 type:complete len:191 (-) Transcript_5805:625-1197(-)